MKQINISHRLTKYPERLNILDAIFVWQLAEEDKVYALAEQEQAFDFVQRATGFSSKRCLQIVSGKAKLDDFKVVAGHTKKGLEDA
jgi:hypothetical protein